MSDGAIIFNTELDNKGLEKDLASVKNKIKNLNDQLEFKQKAKLPLLEQADKLVAELDKAKAKLYEMQNAPSGQYSKAQIDAQNETVKSLQSQWESVQKRVDAYDKSIQDINSKLDYQKEKAGQIVAQLNKTGPGAQRMADAMEQGQKSAQRMANRLKEVARSALIFSVISKALSSLRDWLGKVVKTNAEATAAIARLKGALLTLAQPLVEVIIPAFTGLVNVLTAMVGRIAQLTSALFGTTTSEASKAAEALREETEALEGAGGAAKKASKSLASFDEINKLSGDSSSGGGAASSVAPDFSWAEHASDFLKEIADDVLLIAAGLALWKISDSLPDTLKTIGTKLGWIAVAVGGLILAWDGIKDAWENGVDWGNMAAMIGGVAAAAAGLYLAFGPIASGIALVVGGVALLITGFKDMIENGMNLKNTLLTIAGIIGAGLGISLLTGSFIPLLIAAVSSIALLFVQLTGNGEAFVDALKRTFSGFATFFKNLIAGDIDGAIEGLKEAAKGALDVLKVVGVSVLNVLIKGLNWLIEKINSIGFTVPDWIPELGGKRLSFNIPVVNEIPMLAKGAVIPPNREFLAVLGDQKSGTNIEAPLSTIEQALENVMNRRGGGEQTVVMECDRIQFAKLIYKLGNAETARHGVSLAGVI